MTFRPRLWFAQHTDASGRIHSLAVVSTHWYDQGNCFYEILDAEGGAEPTLRECVDGVWRVIRYDDSPSVLAIDWLPQNGQEEPTDAIRYELERQICAQGLAESCALSD